MGNFAVSVLGLRQTPPVPVEAAIDKRIMALASADKKKPLYWFLDSLATVDVVTLYFLVCTFVDSCSGGSYVPVASGAIVSCKAAALASFGEDPSRFAERVIVVSSSDSSPVEKISPSWQAVIRNGRPVVGPLSALMKVVAEARDRGCFSLTTTVTNRENHLRDVMQSCVRTAPPMVCFSVPVSVSAATQAARL